MCESRFGLRTAVGDKVYVLKGDKAQLDKFTGSPVVVNGDLNGSLITVKNITAAH
jgi:hypothetical protein